VRSVEYFVVGIPTTQNHAYRHSAPQKRASHARLDTSAICCYFSHALEKHGNGYSDATPSVKGALTAIASAASLRMELTCTPWAAMTAGAMKVG
jgi:hypothetical protein